MNREGKKCVLYPRVSTEMQVDGYSLEGQKNGLKRFADREEMEIVGIYEDAGKSGKSIEGRPAFKKMLSDIKNGLEIDYILVYKLSRFGRNAADILNSLEFVQSYGINLICIEEGIDSSQTSGKLLISVLSAVAEIERENIIEQTMNGRREKARQGGWNGGFAPYGYYLKDNQLLIEETEAEAIRIIFDKFANSDIGLGGVAKYLNLQGIKKIPRQNGTLETWSSHFIRLILDNPVYCGKIAYGRRTREKVKGTKNEYKQVHAEDYILEDGQHEGIISEELWQKVHAKRMATGIKQPSKIGKDRSHLLTGILKCPLCGSSMYTNKHAWTNKDGTYKEVYYYICGRNKQERGHHCDYKASLRKTDIEPLVIEAVKELVSDKYFAKEIEKRIGVQIDTTAIDKELANYESKLKEVDLNKARLEREIDNLPIDARFRERKIHDMTLRLDALYDTIVELEERIEDAKLRKSSIEMETITLDNIYKLMLNFGKLYDIISDEEKKSLITYLIKEIQIYPNGESEQPLKSIEFNFPIYRDGQEVRRLLWEKGNTVDTWALCGRWAGATRRGRAAKRTRPRPLTASGAAPRAETVRRRCRWGTAMKRAAAARRMPPKRLTGTRRRPAGACRWGSTIWAACMRQDRASHGTGGRRWSCFGRRRRRSRRPDRRSGGWKKPAEPNGSWAGCWWPMPCSWEQDYGRAAPVTGSSGWRQWPLRRWPEGAVCTTVVVWCRRWAGSGGSP